MRGSMARCSSASRYFLPAAVRVLGQGGIPGKSHAGVQRLLGCPRFRSTSMLNGRRSLASMALGTPADSVGNTNGSSSKSKTFDPAVTNTSNNNDGEKKNPLPNFDDAKEAYAAKTLPQLARAMLSLHLCQFQFIVAHAKQLHRYSRRVLGDWITDTALHWTLFGHFCGGTDEVSIRPKIAQLERAGIGSILDFAAEDDGSDQNDNDDDQNHDSSVDQNNNNSSSSANETADRIVGRSIPNSRVYKYETEQKCDRHVDTFKRCIRAVQTLEKDGFAAVKVTALGNPLLLEKMSRAIIETQRLFAKFDQNSDGFISRDEFDRAFHYFFRDDYTLLKEMLQDDALFRNNVSGDVDYITWSMMLSPRHLPQITQGCRNVGPLSLATPTEEEVELIGKMFQRGQDLAMEAAQCGTRLLIDAEQVRYQPAIDNLVLDLQRNYNTNDFPIIYNTYQCYLKDAMDRLQVDVARSERFSYHFGAKLVRGAYMESERELARELGYESPVHETRTETDRCYDQAAEYLLAQSVKTDRQGKKIELMLATHNQKSIETAIAAMNKLGIDRTNKTLSFGQLFGMMDNLSYGLGHNGYRVYKYVPYGEVKMAMPYLIRRANENSSLTGGAARELAMIKREFRRRIFG